MIQEKFKITGRYEIECLDKNGKLKWQEVIDNLITTEGKHHVLDLLFNPGTAKVEPWYILLTDGSPTVAIGDTLASHAGWVEIVPATGYTGNRKEYVDVRTGLTVSNVVSKASFAILQTLTIGGSGAASVATGTTGILLSVGAFSVMDRSVINGDTVNVTYTMTIS